ncbi:hypothetical protein [Candidatus Aciduliprofundum boonei]|uniref:Uncharacterized protein n=1 Tax=Aciduliprofundum boonei (strain DSM 19572 / T469) TaxID=439481 RepID=B5IC38_ACIB4|nr:hypothetical protein [Candidatus Aciduliprofundum boonei]ADD08876.1 hypothetical protein Aboo_1067 [Aciduliprofundum boonei T469]EDY34395.1 hypothetical protein ABOONEI_938 [Aciduliprofundum boonei T469]EDY36172.1 hypothetical protein ABOONEI_2159 [Aciduliprofundum boonei T469]HII55627.1 hypothetical protein [Candidatus Aciduliprofundum boonei]
MRELKRFQIKRIIEEAMRITNDITLRDTIKLEDIYKIAEAVKGERLTKKEKLMIAGAVSRCYPTQKKLENKELEVLVLM